jgi:hypothetical protein
MCLKELLDLGHPSREAQIIAVEINAVFGQGFNQEIQGDRRRAWHRETTQDMGWGGMSGRDDHPSGANARSQWC